jgi:site-specific DNA-methyltransferase (adenine-specific)
MRIEKIGNATLYLGDCLEILPTLPKVDAVITDPPYGINTKSDGSGKLSPWGDLVNSAHWYAAWMGAARARLQPTRGVMWTCLNWRSIVTFQKAACDIAWPIESLMVWDKCWIGPGGTRGLRPSYELVALFAHGDFGIKDRGLPDVQRFPVGSYKATGHPAEKPQALKDFLVKHSGDGTVLDPFMGSGTTGVAAVQAGREFIGIEMDPVWFESACRRIDEAQKQQPLLPAEPVVAPTQLEIAPASEGA